jgi:tetratricopeptide (TPR) repeat protein/transposase
MAKSVSGKIKQAKQSCLSPEEFQRQVTVAQRLYDQGQLEEAVALLKTTLKAAPVSFTSVEKGEVWEMLGDLYAELGKWQEAGVYYRRYLRFVKEAEGQRAVGMKQVEIYWQENKFQPLLNLLQALHQADPTDWAVLLQLHAIYAAFGWTETADSLAEKLSQEALADPARWRELAAHYLYLAAYEQAEAAAYQALELRPDSAASCVLLAEIAQGQQDDEQAVKWYRRALALAPTEIGYYQELAYLYGVRLEQAEAAEEVLAQGVQEALTLDMTDLAADLLVQQASLLVNRAEWSPARSLLCLALGLVPDHVVALQALAGLYQAQQSWSAAIEIVREHLLPHPLVENSYAQDWLGLLYLQADQPEAALEVFRGLLQTDEAAPEPRYHLALAYKQLNQYAQAQQEVNRLLRHQPHHPGGLALHAELSQRKQQKARQRRQARQANRPATPPPPLEPLKIPAFLQTLNIEAEVKQVATYLEGRYWKERDRRGVKPDISFRTIILLQVVQGIKDWQLAQLYRKLQEKEEEELRLLLGFAADPEQLPTYRALAKRIKPMAIFPLKYLSRKLSRRAVQRGYVQLDEVLLDTSLIAAACDLFRVDPTSRTGYTEAEAAWSYPKYGRRIFGFKLALVTNGQGDILDVAVSPANVDDITLGKQAVERLARTLAGLTIRYLLADSGYCSKSLRELVMEKLGAMPLIGFNPRRGAQKEERFTYLNDDQQWLIRKREIRQTIERTFAYLKQHYGLKNLSVRGFVAVSRYLISRCLGALALSLVAHQLDRPDLKTKPSELLYSY